MKNVIIGMLVIGIAFIGCKKDEETQPETSSPTQSTTTPKDSTTTPSDTNSIAADPNTLIVEGVKSPLNEYTVPSSADPNSKYVRLDVFDDLLDPDKKGYWVVGLNELPTQSTTLESSFSYHWQNLPAGKFYFNSIKDKDGKQWWYTESATIKMDVKIDGDNMTLTCKDITVGDNFLPAQVTETKKVTVSITAKISDIKNATSAGTLFKLVK
ncbi:hypothetical protein KFE98_07650 [bacterium SCSIO 12741]|nr:hypothetical protein KFE98_07650 [bacterium SCSIO 12741]